ncbi:hypothetical protein [Nocardia sp. alder85J]|uniref:hypothetical protein n=1 Tax=Nocardia sp. alder85J TaxID=2862949 RepID=UPI001CD51ED1|nr:hypothetical protein [Nocardia sp. alder85J]MCX4093337.1 hypothetical protein [Nocardia sp. alder85J]
MSEQSPPAARRQTVLITGAAGGMGVADFAGRGAAIQWWDLGNHRLGIPLRRVAQPRDVAAAVRYPASDDARHLTAEHAVAAGYVARRCGMVVGTGELLHHFEQVPAVA